MNQKLFLFLLLLLICPFSLKAQETNKGVIFFFDRDVPSIYLNGNLSRSMPVEFTPSSKLPVYLIYMELKIDDIVVIQNGGSFNRSGFCFVATDISGQVLFTSDNNWAHGFTGEIKTAWLINAKREDDPNIQCSLTGKGISSKDESEKKRGNKLCEALGITSLKDRVYVIYSKTKDDFYVKRVIQQSDFNPKPDHADNYITSMYLKYRNK